MLGPHHRQGSILQYSILADDFSENFLPSNFGANSTQNIIHKITPVWGFLVL
jgi:hypothetical protein